MKHKATSVFALAASLVGTAAMSAQLGVFSEDFETGSVGNAPASGWTRPSGAGADDIFFVTNNVSTDTTKSLYFEVEKELRFTPSTNIASTVSLDVYLTPGSEAPTIPSDAKLTLYLTDGNVLKAGTVSGATTNWTDVATGVSPNAWTTITMTFSGSTASVKVGSAAATNVSLPSSLSTVSNMGFLGTGYVDNFVGSYAIDAGSADDSGSTPDGGTAPESLSISGNSLTYTYSSDALGGNNPKFVRVYDASGKYVTLHTSNLSDSINVSKLGAVSKVVAYYGDGATNLPTKAEITPDAPAVNESTGAVSMGIAAKSGVKYSIVDASGNPVSGATINGNSNPGYVAPENDGDTLNIVVPASGDSWGVQKFKIKAED